MEIKFGSTVVDQNGVEWLVISEINEKGEVKLANDSGTATGQVRLVRDEVAS